MSDSHYSVAQFETMRLEIACLVRELKEAKKEIEQLSVPRMKLYAEIERLQLENHKLHGECGHLQANVKEQIQGLRASIKYAIRQLHYAGTHGGMSEREVCIVHDGLFQRWRGAEETGDESA